METNNNLLSVNNPMIKSFIEGKKGKELFCNYLIKPTRNNQRKLDEAFKYHYLKVKAIAYFSKVFWYESVHYDKKSRKFNDRFLLTLDTPMNDGEGILKKDAIVDPSQNVEGIQTDRWEELIEDIKIKNAISELTKKQQEILIYIYVMEMKDTEVAEKIGVSQQSVSKTKRSALNKIRRELKNG